MARILVVDDDDLLSELVSTTLQAQGHEVATAADGEMGLAMARREPFDLVLLDGLLPDVDGLEVLRELRREPQTAELPVIMLSARQNARDVVGALSLGAADYLIKPFIPQELAARVEKTLSRSRNPT